MRFTNPPKRLNLGCGSIHLDGYMNIDADSNLDPPPDLVADFRDLSFTDIEEVEMSHVLEHISWQEVKAVLARIRSWMAEGGSIRVEVPNMAVIMERGVFDFPAMIAIYGIQASEDGTLNPREAHLSGFSPESLVEVLQVTGWKPTSARWFPTEERGVDRGIPNFPCLEVKAVAV